MGDAAAPNSVVANYCVRIMFSSGKMRSKVFDDHEEARVFSNDMIMRPDVEDVHLWEL